MITVNRVIIAVAVIVLVLFVFWASGCEGRRAIGDQKRIEKGQTGAVIESSRDALNTQAGVSANDVATGDLGRENEREIRNAQGADAPVGGDATAAGIRGLCKRPSYRNRPECRVQ